MKSLLSNYCSRLVTIQDTIIDDCDDNEDNEATDSLSTSSSSSFASTNHEKPISAQLIVKDSSSNLNNNDLFRELDELSELHSSFKYIDDMDTDGSNTISSECMESEENDEPEETRQINSETKRKETTENFLVNNEVEIKIHCESWTKMSRQANNSTQQQQQLMINLMRTNQNVLNLFEKINENFQKFYQNYLKKERINDEVAEKQHKVNNYSTSLITASILNKQDESISIRNYLTEIKSWFCLIKKLILESQDQFKKKMSDKSQLPQIVEDEASGEEESESTCLREKCLGKKNELNNLENLLASRVRQMARDELESFCFNLGDQIKNLKEKIKNIEESTVGRDKMNKEEFNRMKEITEVLRADRKRLKCEKIDLLNQAKELYKTIEAKENEMREFLRHYEAKTKETSFAVKKLIDTKAFVEKEKIDLQTQVFELMEEKNELKLIIESKNAIITKLQKQLFELKTKSARYSLGKESDYGYSSSKSRDTLSSSFIEPNQLKQAQASDLFAPNDSNTTTTATTTGAFAANIVKLKSNLKSQKTKKEERYLKCKSNDCQNQSLSLNNGSINQSFIYEKNPNQANLIDSKLNQKLKNKLTNKSLHLIETNTLSPKPTFATNKLNVDYETDLNKVLDSDEFVDLDDDASSSNGKNEEEDVDSLRQSLSTDCIINSTVICKEILNDCCKYSRNSTATNNNNNLKEKLSKSMYEKSDGQEDKTSCMTSSSISFSTSAQSSTSSSSSSNCVNSSSSSSSSPLITSESNLETSKSSNDSNCLFRSLIEPTQYCHNNNNIMSQSLTICEDNEHLLSNDYNNKQQQQQNHGLSMSMSMHCTPSSNSCISGSSSGGSVSRSSRILHSIMKMSTNSSYLTGLQSQPTLSAGKTQLFKASLSSSKIQKSQNNYDKSKSLYSINDSMSGENSEVGVEETKRLNNVNEWTPAVCKSWLEDLGIFAAQVKNAMKYIKCGKNLIAMSDSELERAFLINNSMHKRKLRLAIDDLKSPEKCKYPKLGSISTNWLCGVWLKEIGLVQLENVFKLNLIDGRVLASLQRKDLEKHLGINKRNLQTSLLLAIDLLRKYDFDIDRINAIRSQAIEENSVLEISLWTNQNFGDWIKLVNLQVFSSNLSESGIHGALVVDNVFNVDYLYSSLKVTEETRYLNMRKILEDEIKLLKKTKSMKQESFKNESAFLRPLSSFKSDKRIFTFRGSLGRALGKKIKRDISSPLIDDDTYKRIEYSHKIIDMKNFASTSAV